MTIASNVIELLDVIKLSKIPNRTYLIYITAMPGLSTLTGLPYMLILTNVPVLPDSPIWIYFHHDRFDLDDQYDQYGLYDQYGRKVHSDRFYLY